MMRRTLAAAALLAAAVPQTALAQDHGGKPASAAPKASEGRAEEEPDPVVAVSDTDVAMNAAIAEARATLPQWLALYRDPPSGYGDFAIKFPLEGYEHIWVAVDAIEGDTVVGRLANAPHAEGWSYGDPVRVSMREVSDWAYWDDKGVAHGYRTVRVLFTMMDPAEVAAIKEQFGWD